MGYRGYQGRGGGASTFLKIIVCILAILVVGGGGYLLALNNGGALPSWLPQGQTTDTPQTPASDTPTQEPDPSDSPEPSPTPSQALETEEIRAVDVTVSQLLDGSAQTLAQQTGCDAVVVEVKGEWGKLQWPSQASLARQLGTVSTTQSLTQALNALAAQDIYLVARVDCFRDQALAAANVGSSLLMTRGGNRWYDSMGMSWVSPVNTQVRQYLVDLCVELSEMGFDELVLDSAYFPDQGEVHVLAQSTNYPDTRATVVEQFWQEVIWKDVDFLFVDMPPGTGDVPLTVFQSLPVDGVVVVTAPQTLVGMIVTKAVRMAEMMKVPVLGLVENYSFFRCPDCGGEHPIFGASTIDALGAELNLPVLAKLPLDSSLANAMDQGTVEGYTPNPLAQVAAQLDAE